MAAPYGVIPPSFFWQVMVLSGHLLSFLHPLTPQKAWDEPSPCRGREPVTLHTKQGHTENRIARYPPLRMHYLQGRYGILVTHSLGSFQIQTHWSLVSALSWAKTPSSPPASNRPGLLPLLGPGGRHFLGQSCSPSAVGSEPYQLQPQARLVPFCIFMLLLLPAGLSECHCFLPRPQALTHASPILTDFVVLCPLEEPTSFATHIRDGKQKLPALKTS